jgi:hypothetical protein
VTIPLTNNDGIAAGDMVRLGIKRLGTAGGDTAAGDYFLTGVEFRDSA